MEILISKQLNVIIYSLILGLIFGGLYDIIRIIHILCGIASYSGDNVGQRRGKFPFVVFLLTDAVFMLTATAAYSIFIYWQMNGVFRLFVFLSVIAGFVIYYNIVGRIVMFFSEAIVRFLRLAALWIFIKPSIFLLNCLKCFVKFLYRNTVGHLVVLILQGLRRIRSWHIKKRFKKDICFADADKRK